MTVGAGVDRCCRYSTALKLQADEIEGKSSSKLVLTPAIHRIYRDVHQLGLTSPLSKEPSTWTR